MMNNKLKIVLAATGVGIIGLAGISHASFVQPSGQSYIAILQQQKQAVKADLGDGDGEKNDDAQEQQGSAKLDSLAKITPQQARTAAEAKQGAKASSVQLENENGMVVYAVIIGKTEVTVDASNGRILSTENN
jgi:uncharacterized membrane protein YkoI